MNDHKNSRKKIKITRLAVGLIIVQSIVLAGVCLAIAILFFNSQVTKVYEEMDENIVSSILASVSKEDMIALAKEVDDVYRSMEDPKKLKEENEEAYLSCFAKIAESDTYKKLWNQINTIRQKTSSTAVDFELFYPKEDIRIFILDACDVNVYPCGKTFTIDVSDYFKNPEDSFNGFSTSSEVYGKLTTDGELVYYDEENNVCSFLLADIPESSIAARTLVFFSHITLSAVLMTILICVLAVHVIKYVLVKPLMNIMDLSEQYSGNYDQRSSLYEESHVFEQVDGGVIKELNDLGTSLQSMEMEMNSYLGNIAHMISEKARINAELDLAKKIQANMLPNTFPAFPMRDEFEIYATMDPAKEVGGDFYDFFMIDDDHLGIVIADVSGKGVPAALFMMMVKIIISNSASVGVSPKVILEETNDKVCQNNKNDMFVSVWFGVLTLSTGEVVAANAGHEYPIIKTGEKFEVLKDKHGLVVGGMEDVSYSDYTIKLETGDVIFVYTDGLAEATNADNVLFGLDRTVEALNAEPDAHPKKLIRNIKDAVDEFVGEAEQFDDLTMLAIRYN